MSVTVCTTYYDPKQEEASSLHVSAKRLDVKVHNFGAKSKFETFARTKLAKLSKFLQTVDTDLVLFLDGNDTVLLDHPDVLAETWSDICSGGVAIGSEKKCWPHPFLKDQLEKRQFECGGGRIAFLDTGFFLGKPADVFAMIEKVLDSIPDWRAQFPEMSTSILEDDVGLFALNICDGSIDPFVDYSCRFIVPLKGFGVKGIHHDGDDVVVPGFEPRPHVLHCNGGRFRDRNKLAAITSQILGQEIKKGRKA